MKKLIIVIAGILFLFSWNKHQKIIIPRESIRFRVIASSNEEKDQRIKKEVVNRLKPTLMMLPTQNVEDTRNYIQKELPKLETIVEEVVEERPYTIHYGKNYFPRKEYQNVVYEEGEYESLVITLGKGEGDNFWCVLFPPICFLEEEEDVEYHSFLKDMIQKYFS